MCWETLWNTPKINQSEFCGSRQLRLESDYSVKKKNKKIAMSLFIRLYIPNVATRHMENVISEKVILWIAGHSGPAV
jgi:hypothetical protein